MNLEVDKNEEWLWVDGDELERYERYNINN